MPDHSLPHCPGCFLCPNLLKDMHNTESQVFNLISSLFFFHFKIVFSEHISDNKKGQNGSEGMKTGQPRETSSSQALQNPGAALNGHYSLQSRGGNLPPPSIAVSRPPEPRGYGMPGFPPGNPRFPGAQSGMPRCPPNYR